MAIRPVLKMGDPRLWQRAEAVRSFGTDAMMREKSFDIMAMKSTTLQ